MKSGIKAVFYPRGKSLNVYELETSGFVGWIDVVADKFPTQSVSTGCVPAEKTSEQEFSCDCICGLLQVLLGWGTLIGCKWTIPPMCCFQRLRQVRSWKQLKRRRNED